MIHVSILTTIRNLASIIINSNNNVITTNLGIIIVRTNDIMSIVVTMTKTVVMINMAVVLTMLSVMKAMLAVLVWMRLARSGWLTLGANWPTVFLSSCGVRRPRPLVPPARARAVALRRGTETLEDRVSVVARGKGVMN